MHHAEKELEFPYRILLLLFWQKCLTFLLCFLSLAPGKPPSGVKAEPLNTTAIKVSWTKIPQEYIVDGLLEYATFYSTENATVPNRKSVHGFADTAVLNDLQPETTYSIQVVGVNRTGGLGPLSSVVTAKTFRGKR